jgi:hypothetical protein
MADLPRLTILRGDDLARVQALLTEFKAGIGDALTAEMNTTLLDADTLNLDALRAGLPDDAVSGGTQVGNCRQSPPYSHKIERC